jgi:CRISPR-associated protein Csb2
MPDTFPTRSTPTLTYTPPGSGAVLGLFGPWRPPISLALPIADRVRVALMRACDSTVPWQITGKDPHGRPRSDHRHLYVLPFAGGDAPGLAIDRVLLWARGGLDDATLTVLDTLHREGGWIRLGGRPPLRLELLGVGSRERLGGLVPHRVVGRSAIWRSATSFIAPRFPKHRGQRSLDAVDEQLRKLAGEVLGSTPHTLEPIEIHDRSWAEFAQTRLSHPNEPLRPASGWVLRFAEPINGPLVLGHGAHFGLGRFEAVIGGGR